MGGISWQGERLSASKEGVRRIRPCIGLRYVYRNTEKISVSQLWFVSVRDRIV
jgi:hypothetical protein